MAKFTIACVLFSLVAVALASDQYKMGSSTYGGYSRGGYGKNGPSDDGYMMKRGKDSYGGAPYGGRPYSDDRYMKNGPYSGGYEGSSDYKSYDKGSMYSAPTYGSGRKDGYAKRG